MGACDCHPLYGRKADRFGNNGARCDDSCLHAETVADPDEDLDRRIASEVEKAISDIISDAINRCISTSLKDCVAMA
jgi:hypothetical protein